MLNLSRSFWRCMVIPAALGGSAVVCAAQATHPQFANLPEVQLTGGQVQQIVAGHFQTPPGSNDLLYVNAPAATGATSSVTVGQLLNQQGFTNLGENQITFQGAAKVRAAAADFDNDGYTDYVFVVTPSPSNGMGILCVYYGTGAGLPASRGSQYDGGNVYPPAGSKSGCLTFTALSDNPFFPPVAPDFEYVVTFPLTTGGRPDLMVEDVANQVTYVFANQGGNATNGVLANFTLLNVIHGTYGRTGQVTGGEGPILVGDFNNDGKTDAVIDVDRTSSKTNYNITDVLVGNGDGTFQIGQYVLNPKFNGELSSVVMIQPNSGQPYDMVGEAFDGSAVIWPMNPDGTFLVPSTPVVGGAETGLNGYNGGGGKLVAVNPSNLDILAVTPIGLSVLGRDGGTLAYRLKGTYDIGPGRESFALGDFLDTGNQDLAVNSAEGVAIIPGNPDGTFRAPLAFPTLAPALSAAAGKFRTQNNPNGNVDVAVATGVGQAQLLTGNGDGTFNTFPTPTDSMASQLPVYPGEWENLLAADFDGDGNPDLLHVLTGLPSPAPQAPFATAYVQYGNGDGTFSSPPLALSPPYFPLNQSTDIAFWGVTVGDWNGDGTGDFAYDSGFEMATMVGVAGNRNLGFSLAGNTVNASRTPFQLVAAGQFLANRSHEEDWIFQQGASLVPQLNLTPGGSGGIGGPGSTGQKPALQNTPPATALALSALLLTDMDGDGKGDVVALYYPVSTQTAGPATAPAGVYIWWGKGDGTFSAAPTVISLSRNYYLAAVADMDGDGLPDIILSDGSLVSILYNQGNRSFYQTVNGQQVLAEQHFLAGQGINAILPVDVNGDGHPDLIAANGGATVSNAIALGGTTAATLALTPNPDVNTGGITVLLNNALVTPVTGTLTASPEPSVLGQAFTLTATITPSAGVALPTGTVQFEIDGANVSSPVALTQGAMTSTAVYTVPAGNGYVAGNHTLGAVYSGDAANAGKTLTGTHAIGDNSTTTQLDLCVGPTAVCPSIGYVMPPYSRTLTMSYGQDWNGTAVVTAADGGQLLGDTVISISYNGTPATIVCTLSTQNGGSCPANVGTTGLGVQVGTNTISASYTGDATHTGSSSTVVVTVIQDTTTAVVSCSPNPSPAQQPVICTATLTGNGAPPTGTVTFAELFPPTALMQQLGTATLVPGTGLTSTATFTTSVLPVGTDTIESSYGGTSQFAAALATTTETITPSLAGSFTLTVTPNPATIGVGLGEVLAVTVTPMNGFVQDVNLTCGNLPYEVTCAFVNPTIAGGSGTTQLIVQTTAPHSCGSTAPYFQGESGGGLGGFGRRGAPLLGAGLLLLLAPARRRRWLKLLMVVAAVLGAMEISGCGNCTDLGTRPATYTIEVTGTAAAAPSGSPAATSSQAVTVSVTI